MLLQKIEEGEAVLIVGLDDARIPDIHNFYPRKYYTSIEHLGYGFFEGKTEHGTFSFDGGGAMHHHDLSNEGFISWSYLRTENAEVLKDLLYDFEKVKSALKEIISQLP
jgi:hypothetical protein